MQKATTFSIKIKVILLSLIALLLISCGSDEELKDKAAHTNDLSVSDIKVDNKAIYLYRNSVTLASDGLVYLYHKGKQLYIHINKNDVLLADDVPASKHQWVSVSGKYVYAFWWRKYGTSLEKDPKKLNKTIYVRVSDDGGKTFSKTRIINSESGRPLANLKIVSDDKGNATIYYPDERFPVYEVYTQSTHDGGKSWSKSLMMNARKVTVESPDKAQKKSIFFAVEPKMAKIGNEIVIVWYESFKEEDDRFISRVYSRTSLDQGKTWGDIKEIYVDKDNHSLQMQLYANNKQLFLVVTQARKGLYVLHKEQGKDWSIPSDLAPGTDKAKSASSISMAADDKYLYVTYIEIPRNAGLRQGRTILQRYNLQTNKWESKAHRLDAVFGLNKSRGGYHDIALLEDGTLLAVWEDYRYILPVILLSYTSDHGETWSSPVKVFTPKNKTTHVVERYPYILTNKNSAQIFFEYSDLKEGSIPLVTTKRVEIESPKLKKLVFQEAVLPSGGDRQKKLIRRYEALMKARVAKDWSKAWGFIDPVYRNLYSKNSWISTRSRMKYSDYNVQSAEIHGSEGTVSGTIVFSIGNSVPGVSDKSKHLKNQRMPLKMRWGWFGDDWYYIAEDSRTPYLP